MNAGLWPAAVLLGLTACTSTNPPLRGTGDLGLVVERSAGSVMLIETTRRSEIGRVAGLGDLSHASAVFSRDGRYAYVFGRDGGLSKVDLLRARVEHRVVQSGNAIGGAISQDGKLVVDSGSPYIGAVHDAMRAAFSYQGDDEVTSGP